MEANDIVIGGRYLWNVFGEGWIVRITGQVTGGWTAIEEETDFPIDLVSEDYLVRILADTPPIRPLHWSWSYRPSGGLKLTREGIDAAVRAFRPHTQMPVVGAAFLVSRRALRVSSLMHPTYALVQVTYRTVNGAAWAGLVVPLDGRTHAQPIRANGIAASLLHEQVFRTLAEKRMVAGGL